LPQRVARGNDVIIELVDSICRDSVETQYMIIQKKFLKISKLRDFFTMVFAQNSSILDWAVHQPIAFSQQQSHEAVWNRSLKNYGFISSASLVHMHKNHLVTKQLLFKIAELEIRLRAWRQWVSGIHCWLSVWTEWFFSQYCMHRLRKPMRTGSLDHYLIKECLALLVDPESCLATNFHMSPLHS